jgi:hypothetical protein
MGYPSEWRAAQKSLQILPDPQIPHRTDEAAMVLESLALLIRLIFWQKEGEDARKLSLPNKFTLSLLLYRCSFGRLKLAIV